ncbi:hypothetical protein [Gallaecimonas sp. GXIMD1310]|uniref:hypothetical protein n=1 Tax=Gallaecimonas sp. GXIMD1310 TaxID=3131926 RepID=UPI00324B8CAD
MESPTRSITNSNRYRPGSYLLWLLLAVLLHGALLWWLPLAEPPPALPLTPKKAIHATLLVAKPAVAQSAQAGSGDDRQTDAAPVATVAAGSASPPGRKVPVKQQGSLAASPKASPQPQQVVSTGDFSEQLQGSLQRLQQQRQQQWLDQQHQASAGPQAIQRPQGRSRKAQIIDLGGNDRLYRGPNGECALLRQIQGLQGPETVWLQTSLCSKPEADIQSFINKRIHGGG